MIHDIFIMRINGILFMMSTQCQYDNVEKSAMQSILLTRYSHCPPEKSVWSVFDA
jgi:hypothetical protein